MAFRRFTLVIALVWVVSQSGCSPLYEAGKEDVVLTQAVDAATVLAAVRSAPGVEVRRVEPAEPYKVLFVFPGTHPEFIGFTDTAAPRMLGSVQHPPGSAQVSVTGRYAYQRSTEQERTAARQAVQRVVKQLQRTSDGAELTPR
jgi:hypothetical protein